MFYGHRLARQLLPRDGENIDLRTARVGDRIYSCVFIDLFPKEVQQFIDLFTRTLQTQIPWRISFLIEGGGLGSLRITFNIIDHFKFFFSAKSFIQ